MSFTPSRSGSGNPAQRMMQSPSLPMLPGMRQFTPKRKSYGRQALFQCGEGGVMLEKMRPASSPSRQQQSGASPIPRSPALLRPSSALGTVSTPQRAYQSMQSSPLVTTVRRKEAAINALKTLEPLAINQKRVALQREIQHLESEENQMKLQNTMGTPDRRLRKSASALSVSKLPKWVEFDREVLRWYAYSKDTVPER